MLLMYEQFVLDHPEMVKASEENYVDPEYESSERALDVGEHSQKPDETEIADPELPPILS